MKKTGRAVSVLLAAVIAAGVSAPAAFAASPYIKSDTTIDFTVNKNNTYAFKFTEIGSHADPHIAAGNGAVLRTESVRHVKESGNDVYYFKVRAIGSVGQESAVYTTLPGQSAVRHCKIKVGVEHHKSYDTRNGFVSYYDGVDTNSKDAFGYYEENPTLAVNRKKQYFIDYMSYMGYKHNASLDNANIWTTPTAEQYEQVSTGDCDTGVEKGLEASANDLIAELKKHKTTEYGVHTVANDLNVDYDTEQIIPTFKSNLTYTTNPAPDFTSKYYHEHLNRWAGVNAGNDVTVSGEGLGCNEYVIGRTKEITGINIPYAIEAVNMDQTGAHPENYNEIKALGYKMGTEPQKDSIAIEPCASGLGHFEYVESVDGNNITLSGAGELTTDNVKYYGTVTRTKQELQDWNTVYVYLK